MARPTRVAFTVPKVGCGGVEMLLLRLAQHLRVYGHDVDIVATQERGEWFDRVNSLAKAVFIDGRSGFPRCVHPLRVGRYLAGAGYDVVFLNGDPMSQQALNMLPDHVVAIPVIHSDNATTYKISLANQDSWNAVIGVGPRVCEVAREQRPGRPVFEINGGVEIPPDEDFGRRRQVTDGEFRVVFLGRITQYSKNVLALPDILRRCRDSGTDARLTIVGDGDDLGALKAAVEGHGMEPWVTFMGRVAHDEVYPILLDHHSMLLPSFFEGFPTVVLEAQACGCVPVASRLPGVTTTALVEGDTGWLADVTDPQQFADALTRMHQAPDEWARMSVAGRALAVERFSAARMAQGYAAAIEKAISGEFPLPRSRQGRVPVDVGMYWREVVPHRNMKAVGRRLLRAGA